MTVTRTDLPLRLLRRGKVRDVYEVDRERVLLVATDRVSAFDVVMAEPIPRKGAVLTQITAWWLRQLESRLSHHMISATLADILHQVPSLALFAPELDQRSMLCRRADVFPVECVIRGYISGSAWKEYAERGTLAGEPLPEGLTESERLPSPIFSPATKAEAGHDENISIFRMESAIGRSETAELERLTRSVYEFGNAVAAERGIIIADTKLEFGYLPPAEDARRGDEFDSSRVILVDEVLTPDSSRFWPADLYRPGRPQPSFDKQPLRDYLDGERRAGRWDGESPPPPLPPDVVNATSERYLEIFRRLTLAPLAPGAFN
ncbi:MAG: phosphoribosylaminoimidazolesuccinocarboxamide synthase [Gemmatimonadaceae bacterium]|nr:phosphoribosylaminoimidazolesuccinocarboxamide synthase [Gemmatimonadaceae bacterium]